MKKLYKKIRNFKFVIRNCQKGMSYVELIVVLSIFSGMTSVVLFNYGGFQAKVDIKNLASDIALKIVEAQKSSLSGKLPPTGAPYDTWKPSYGVYFDSSTALDTDSIPFNKKFIYFADFNNNKIYDETALDTILITNNNSISEIHRCTNTNCNSPILISNPFSITFKRPDSKANFTYQGGSNLIEASSDYIRITIVSPKEPKAVIKIYPSGRIQVN